MLLKRLKELNMRKSVLTGNNKIIYEPHHIIMCTMLKQLTNLIKL